MKKAPPVKSGAFFMRLCLRLEADIMKQMSDALNKSLCHIR